MKEVAPAISTPEQEARYNRVVFGHRFREFDRDQLMTYYFAYKAGLITLNTPVECTATVSHDDLSNSKVMVIEGVPKTAKRNTIDFGNFDNDAGNGDPAAWMLQQRVRNQFARELQPRMQELANWFRARELKVELKQPLTQLDGGALGDLCTHVLRGVKDESQSINQLLTQAIPLIDDVVLGGKSWQRSDNFERLKTNGRRSEAREENILREHFLNPDTYIYTKTLSGKKLMLLDCFGTHTDSGISTVTNEILTRHNYDKPDLVMIIADTLDDNGVSRGARIILQSNNDVDEGVSLQEVFEDRLNYLESLFGRGYQAIFGGHADFQGSDKVYGSGLNPRHLWFALQRFLDVKRYSLEQFKSFSHDFAMTTLGVTTVHHEHQLESRSPTSLPDRYFEVALPNNGDLLYYKTLKIYESDIPYYEEVFNNYCEKDSARFSAVLAEQNDMQYPRVIAQTRRVHALEIVENYQKSNSPIGLLDAISQLAHKDLIELPLDHKLKLLEIITASEEAIDAVWNADNSTYRITSRAMPNHIASDARMDARAKFLYQSVSQLVDQELLQGALHLVTKEYTIESALRLVTVLESITKSASFTESHSSSVAEYRDRVLDTYCGCVLLIEQQGTLDGAHVSNLFQDITERYPYYALYVQRGTSVYSEQLRGRIPGTSRELEQNYETTPIPLRSNPNSAIIYKGDSVLVDIIQQFESSRQQPIVSVRLELGRTIDDTALSEYGITRIGGSIEQNPRFASVVSIGSTIEMGPDSNEVIVIRDALCAHIKQLVDTLNSMDSNASIRIVSSGLPNQLVVSMVARLIHFGIADRVLFGNYNMQTAYYFDTLVG
jgi:hypothetical protein